MERIKQALEKARQERQLTGGLPGGSFGAAKKHVSPSSVTYTQTKTVEVSSDLMKDRRILSEYHQGVFPDAYKMLRTQVLQRLGEKGWNSLAVTSPGVSEGKTLTAINLAISLSMEVNYTVLLVDADLRHPGVHTHFGINAERGLSDYLTDSLPLSDLLIHPANIPGFVILPGGKPLLNSAEMLNSPKMIRLVEELKSRYPSRIVIFDLPPVLNAADALAFSPYVDAALLVIEEGKSQREDVKHAVELLQCTNLIGTVLNKSRSGARDRDEKSIKWLEATAGKLQLYYQLLKQWLYRLRKARN
jgi:capsular exopolysaccharide synthesis family protein